MANVLTTEAARAARRNKQILKKGIKVGSKVLYTANGKHAPNDIKMKILKIEKDGRLLAEVLAIGSPYNRMSDYDFYFPGWAIGDVRYVTGLNLKVI